jgi:hypothetical protein
MPANYLLITKFTESMFSGSVSSGIKKRMDLIGGVLIEKITSNCLYILWRNLSVVK